jgi:HK97 family phage portal protein
MTIWSRLFGGGKAEATAPRNAYQPSGGGTLITSSEQLEAVMLGTNMSGSGMPVTQESSMRVAAVYACVRIRSGVPANMPLDIKRRVDDRTRVDASDHSLWRLFKRRPNMWQTPSQFKRMMTAHLMLRGNAYAMIVRSRGNIIGLIPLHPDRTECKQLADNALIYEYTRKSGGRITLKQDEVFHLVGLTLDGVHGVSLLTYMRETIGLALAEEEHGASVFKNGARPSNVLSHPGKLGKDGIEFLRASLDDYRAGGEKDGKTLILEEGMKVEKLGMTAQDSQWIESRKFSRSDIAMFFGVPPHMIGDTEKNTSWGTGIEAQTQGFVTFTAEDDLTTWEESINRDLLSDDEPDIFARFNRNSLVRGDLKARKEYYVAMRQWGILCPDEIRAFEDMNPRPDGRGDEYAEPPNTAGSTEPKKDDGDEPANPA